MANDETKTLHFKDAVIINGGIAWPVGDIDVEIRPLSEAAPPEPPKRDAIVTITLDDIPPIRPDDFPGIDLPGGGKIRFMP